MCWSKKCCYFLELDVGCLLIGILSLILSTGIWTASIVFLSMVKEKENWQLMHNATEHVLGVFHLDVDTKSKVLVLSIILLIAVLSTMSSISLIIGVRRHVAGCVLVYFAFGIFMTFFMGLSSLLLLLKNSWEISLMLIGASLINIHFLVAVHTFYELLLRGKVFWQTLHRSDFDDSDLLVETEN